MCMQFTLLDKMQVRFSCSSPSLLLVIPCRKATNSVVPGARQFATDSAQHVDKILVPCI